jgi:hypothetical protein
MSASASRAANAIDDERRPSREDLLRRAGLGWDVGQAGEGGDAVGLEIGAGEDGEDAGPGQGGGRVDRLDAGMRVGRAQDGRVGLPGKIDVIEIATAAGEQSQILLADNRLTHPELHGNLSVLCGSLHIVERAARHKNLRADGHAPVVRRDGMSHDCHNILQSSLNDSLAG